MSNDKKILNPDPPKRVTNDWPVHTLEFMKKYDFMPCDESGIYWTDGNSKFHISILTDYVAHLIAQGHVKNTGAL